MPKKSALPKKWKHIGKLVQLVKIQFKFYKDFSLNLVDDVKSLLVDIVYLSLSIYLTLKDF